jgi:hypothetical protein
MFLKNAKPTRLFYAFTEGVQFFWQVGRVELEIKRQVTPTLYPNDGYYFEYDPKFRPLLNPPAPEQSSSTRSWNGRSSRWMRGINSLLHYNSNLTDS